MQLLLPLFAGKAVRILDLIVLSSAFPHYSLNVPYTFLKSECGALTDEWNELPAACSIFHSECDDSPLVARSISLRIWLKIVASSSWESSSRHYAIFLFQLRQNNIKTWKNQIFSPSCVKELILEKQSASKFQRCQLISVLDQWTAQRYDDAQTETIQRVITWELKWTWMVISIVIWIHVDMGLTR